MKLLSRRWTCPLLLIAAAVLAGCASQRPAASVETYIADRSREWTDAYVTGNTGVLEEIIAEDFLGTTSKGARYTKQRVIQDAKGKYFVSNRLVRIEVRVYGTTALAFGTDVMVLKTSPTVEESAAWTDTWLLRDGRWQVVASHESKMTSGAAN